MTGSYTGKNDLAAVCPVIILGVPCFELGLTMAARWRRGVPVYYGSNDHVAKRFEKLGLSKTAVLIIHCGASLLLGGLALFIMSTDIKTSIITVSALAVVALALAVFLLRVKMDQPGEGGQGESYEA